MLLVGLRPDRGSDFGFGHGKKNTHSWSRASGLPRLESPHYLFQVLERKRPGENHQPSRNRRALARTVNAGRGTQSAGYLAKGARAHALIRCRGIGEVRVVEYVVSLKAEDELPLLFDREAALQRHVDIEVSGAPEAVRRNVAPIGLESGSGA